MRIPRFLRALTATLLLHALPINAGFDPTSKSNIAIYWGQNSAGRADSQTRLADYCSNPDIDIILLSFLLRFSGPGNEPVLNFANQGDKCDVFPSTQLFSCPEIASDIMACQDKNKTVLLSLGGDSYTEGGFTSPALATEAAEKMWAMFGPRTEDCEELRPFGDAVVDGFDFDFEATVLNMGVFGMRLRELMDESCEWGGDHEPGKRYYLSAAPQCPFPDLYNKDIIDTVPLDFLNIQFYNNGCGASSFKPGGKQQWNFNLETWDEWARSESKNPDVKVLLGLPAGKKAGRGYMCPKALGPVVRFSKEFEAFGGVMMWDASQAWENEGFVEGVKGLLGG
ncbi:glycoside hydrolase family 18 protein, partial [Sporormia fimetaria CBS 119925]